MDHRDRPATTLMRRRTLRGIAAAGVAAGTGLALAAGPAATQSVPAGVVCANPPSYSPGGGLPPAYGVGTGGAASRGNPGRVTLSREQLLINQRISQAAIRRVNAVQAWLDAGVVGTDICGGALGPEDLGGVTYRLDPPDGFGPAATPRPLRVAAAGGGDPSEIRLSREQLLINQRISQAAVRRSNALRTRLLTGLTGGDVRDGSIVRGNLRRGLVLVAATAVPTPPAPSTTVVRPAVENNPAGVALSRDQLLINQRISQAAVRRSNALIAHIRTGLNGRDFRANTITAVDLAPGAVGG